IYCLFFFSSRRRHTRLQGDWSSDVCSSDLRQAQGFPMARSAAATTIIIWLEVAICLVAVLILGVGSWTWVRPAAAALLVGIALRSEERRVGKEWGARWSGGQ